MPATSRSRLALAVSLAAALAPLAPPAASAATPPADAAALIQMRQEEKLARDVYLTLAQRVDLVPLARIARSEQVHMNAVRLLLARRGIADPVAGMGIGEFANPAFSRLYRELVAAGSASPQAAAVVGQRIERLDIADLVKARSATRAADMRTVFTRLARASRNHLRAFTRFA